MYLLKFLLSAGKQNANLRSQKKKDFFIHFVSLTARTECNPMPPLRVVVCEERIRVLGILEDERKSYGPQRKKVNTICKGIMQSWVSNFISLAHKYVYKHFILTREQGKGYASYRVVCCVLFSFHCSMYACGLSPSVSEFVHCSK
jgi:hypothetical protein